MTVHEGPADGSAAALCCVGPAGSRTLHEVAHHIGVGGLPCSASRLVLFLA